MALRATRGPGGGSQADPGWIGSSLARRERICCRPCGSSGYQVCLFHPAQMHAFAEAPEGASPQRISSMRSALREHCSAEKRAWATCRVSRWPPERRTDAITAPTRADDVVRYKNEIHALLVVLFPEFTQVFVDPTRPTALAVLKRFPSAQAIAQTEVESRSRVLA